jgi:hypothetical protein
MTPQEEELIKQIAKKLDDQLALIEAHCEDTKMYLASILKKLARLESLRSSPGRTRHGAPYQHPDRICDAAQRRMPRPPRCRGTAL